MTKGPQNVLSGKEEARRFFILQAFRLGIGILILLFAHQVIEFQTSLILLGGAVLLGVLRSGSMLKNQHPFLKTLVSHLGFLFLAWLSLQGMELLVTQAPTQTGDIAATENQDFLAYRFADHIWLLLSFYFVSFYANLAFWCFRIVVTLEAVIYGVLFIWLLSAHRQYQIDAPRNISSLAWDLGLLPQHFLLILGAGFTLFLGAYFVLSHERPLFRGEANRYKAGRVRKTAAFITPALLLACFFGLARYIDSTYSENLSRASNGVGTRGNSEGQSPLGFHSAVGKTRQPSALVRLEGDYAENPTQPMLYLREGALSAFGGKELVVANRVYDQDVPRVKPGDPFVSSEPPRKDFRKKVVQSVYLLTSHNSPFAVDYPYSYRLIQNPDEDRFTLAYQAVSYAPTVPLEQLIGEEVGAADWDQATWDHYLRAPGSRSLEASEQVRSTEEEAVQDQYGEDLRYAAKARELTKGLESPIQKAAVIINFLSQESIYTRKPGHQTTETGDPVAPYLFAEQMRGYCVHFAHAAVYLFRLLGIPSRIGTGYLTDLTYAKDGHILLHLGDRHAWPEIYVRGIGWVVLDVVPANAENEQAIVPDEKLLEELMSKINPVEELAPPPPTAPEDEVQPSVLGKVVNKQNTMVLFALLLSSFLLMKIWLRHAWRFTASPARASQRAYIAAASILADWGVVREEGETRREFTERLTHSFGLDSSKLQHLTEQASYARRDTTFSQERIQGAVEEFQMSHDKTRSRWRRLLGFLSPLSLGRLGKW